jgi:uncharacterized protein (DUF934 family)
MPRLIDTTGTVLPNPWQLLPRGGATSAPAAAAPTTGQENAPAPPVPVTLETALAQASTHLLVNAALWLSDKAGLLQSGKQIAVWLDSDQGADLIAADLPHLPLVALNFPGFMDGRAYSTAVVLRKHHGYTGEIRAIGDVLRDQLFYMKRCGFTTFDLKDSVKLEDAQRAFGDFSATYASTVEEPQPLFRRRAGGP